MRKIMGKTFEPEIIYVTKSEYKEGWGFKPHCHEDYYQLITVMSGSCTIEVDGAQSPLKEGWSVLIAKGSHHALYTEKEERAVVVDIKFVLHGDEGAIAECVGIKATDDEEFLRGMDLIANEAVRKRHMFKELIDSRLCEQLISMARTDEVMIHHNLGENYFLDLAGVAVDIARYVEEHYAQPLTLDDIAEDLGYSKIYLCQCFKKQAGMGIFTYLYDIRLRHAKRLLQDTDLSHDQIIARTGFKTVNHFSRYFKQVYGVSPGRMRRQMKEIMDVPVLLSEGYDLKLDNRAIKE